MLLTSSPYYYAPVVGIKTGSTDESGRCVISQAEDAGYHYLCVVMGAPPTASEPYPNFIETRQFYRWAFGNFSLKTLLEQGELMAEVPVKYSGDGKIARLAVKDDVVKLLRDDITPRQYHLQYRAAGDGGGSHCGGRHAGHGAYHADG